MNKNYIAAAAIGLLVIGGGYIVYSGRPVVQMERQENEQAEAPDSNGETAESAPVPTENGATAPAPSIAIGEPNPSAPQPVDVKPAPSPAAEKPSGPKSYSMADVEAHASVGSCWSAINGSVYDLTTWINRHPGGPEAISRLCGTDGSTKFNRKHGTFMKAQDALVLLKIGALK